MIVIPTGIDFVKWANNLYIDLPSLNIPVIKSEDNWKEWGQRLIEENRLVNAPIPNNYNNWKIWAQFFINNVV